MSDERLVLKFEHASAPLRRAAIEEVSLRRFGGTGSASPRIKLIIVEYDPPEPSDLFQGHEGSSELLASAEPGNDDWAV